MRSKSIDCSVEVVAETEVEAEADEDDNDDCELLFDDLISDPGLDLAGEWRISIWRLERSLFIPEFVIVLAVVAVAVAEVAADGDEDNEEGRPGCMGILAEDAGCTGTICSWTTFPCDDMEDGEEDGFGRGAVLAGGWR